MTGFTQPLGELPQEAYASHRALLLGALARLARQGYLIAPDDGIDLVHDFLAYVWPGLLGRYDPARGQLSTFVYAAFVRFARPRIIRLRRWTLDARIVDQQAGDESQAGEAATDIHKLRRALAKLSSAHRELLLAHTEGDSERELALRHKVTRYRVRQALDEALARLASDLQEPAPITQHNWAVRKQRVVKALVRAFPARTGGGKPMATKLCDLWAMLCERHDDSSIERARDHALDLAEHIDDCPTCSERVPADADAIAAVYEALAGDASNALDGDATELLRLRSSVDAEVREAVESILYASLPESLVRRAEAWDTLGVFRAIDAIAMLLQRESEAASGAVYLSAQWLSGPVGYEPLPASVIVREVCVMARLEQREASDIFGWLLEAVRVFPQLMPGLRANPRSTGEIEFVATAQTLELDLALQWAPAFAELRHGETVKPATPHAGSATKPQLART